LDGIASILRKKASGVVVPPLLLKLKGTGGFAIPYSCADPSGLGKSLDFVAPAMATYLCVLGPEPLTTAAIDVG
jgi:hypothetical protein